MTRTTQTLPRPEYSLVQVDRTKEREQQAARARGVRAAARARRAHMRRMAAPVLWLLTLQGGGWLFWAMPFGPLFAAAVATLAGVVALAKARPRGGNPYALAVTSGAALWLQAASLAGPFGWMALLLWAGGVVCGIPHWRRHRAPYTPPSDEPADADLEGIDGNLTLEQKVWAARVASPARDGQPAGALVGSQLGRPDPVTGGWTATIAGVPGVHDLDKIMGATRKIASAYEVNRAQVMVEEAGDGAENHGQLTVITRADNLERVYVLEDDGAQVDLETGLGRIGYFADAKPTHWSFFTTTAGAQMGLIAGGTGSGKSRAVESKIAMEHRCPAIVPILIDAQDGSSMPDWNGHTWRTALGIEDAFAEFVCLDWVMRGRAHLIARMTWVDDLGRERHGKPFLLPCAEMPMFAVNLDEAPLLLQDETYGARAVKLLSAGGKTWRKAGGAITLITQVPSLEELKSQTLRAMLRGGGTVISFRTGESVSQGMLGMLNDPSKLPEYFPGSREKTHGLGYIVGVDQRQATYRHMLTRDPYAIATSPPAATVDPKTLELFDRYATRLKRAKVTKQVPDPAQSGGVPAPTSGDVTAALQQALAAANGRGLDLGSIVATAGGRIKQCSLGEIKAALKTLEADGSAYRTGDTYHYVTDREGS